MVVKHKNIGLEGKHARPVVTDVIFNDDKQQKPVLIFCHGYKGFKDWGVWDLMAESLAKNGIFFIKFNFSFNGGTLEQPIDFPDLDAFGKNTFIKELDDIEVVLDWLSSPKIEFNENIDKNNITLMGHSRGGGTAIIKASEDERIHKLITLAAVADFEERFPSGAALEEWKENGIGYVENSRTKQKMPHLYEFYENFKANQDRLTISKVAKSLKIPFLIIHGSEDPTVDIENAKRLKKWVPEADLFILEGSNHVFEGSHPWKEKHMPEAFQKITEKVTEFIRK
ncbi:MAG TPA: alpha/beta fold hydrolase [Salinimicrobium sp.]|nr:alpha/beta fold hydrolase [Salinimicrobium sp.]